MKWPVISPADKRPGDRFDLLVCRTRGLERACEWVKLVRQNSPEIEHVLSVSSLLELSLTGAAIHVWERLRERVSEHPWYRHTGNLAINGKPSVLQLLMWMQLNARAPGRPREPRLALSLRIAPGTLGRRIIETAPGGHNSETAGISAPPKRLAMLAVTPRGPPGQLANFIL